MGKSPAKWIKSVLFGKKGSRSNTPNGRHASKATLEKETWVTAKEPTTDFPVDPPSVSEPITSTAHVKEESLDVEEESADDIPCDDGGMLPKNRDAEMHDITASEVLDDPERIRQEQAAIKAQAAFRGYLARRAFWALKGIIRLQALVRGHLVRRQAIATLRCLQGIIKFQAVVRGRKVKLSDAGLEAHKKFKRPLDGTVLGSAEVSTSIQRVKLSENVFVSKLLRSSTTVIPLRLPYIQEEPNSAWSWLERWTSSRLCESVPQPKKVNGSKSQLRQDQGRSKRTIRRTSPGNVDNGMPHSASETEKPKRILRKVVSHPTDPIQEQPQNELEKVKRSLRKVSNSLVDSTDPLEVESEKPKRIQRKESNPQVSDIPDKITCDSAEKMTKNITVETKSSPRKVLSSPPPDIPDITTFDSAETTEENFTMASEEADVIITSNPLVAKEPVNGLHKDPPLELQPSETITKDESTRETNVDEISKDSPTNHDNQKTSQRRSSFTVKEDNPENGLQNSPTLPSYMAATQSAKAKLRGQGSPKVGQDVAEKNGFTRRHSLPSSTNGKLNSVSPRPQRLVQTNGKGGPKNDKSLLSSRDSSEKVVQAGWRR